MRGPKMQAIVCRTEDGLVEKTEELRLLRERYPFFGLPLVLCLFTLLMSGCSLLDLNRFKYKVNSITDDLFSQATITMPVLVTPTSTPTSTPIPPAATWAQTPTRSR